MFISDLRMSQVEALSNVELREALVEFGVSPGPITGIVQ